MTTVLEILKRHGIDHRLHNEHHHVSRNFVGIDCWVCSPGSKRFRMGIHLSRHYSTCYVCGWKPLEKTLQEITGCSKEEVSSWQLVRSRAEGVKEDRVRGKLTLPENLGPLLEPHRRYLLGRGFDPRELEEVWGLQGIGISHQLAWRIWIPIHLQGEVVSWTTRSLVNTGLRYLNVRPEQEKVSAKKVLYGWDYVQHACLVCEGPADVWAVGPGAVASMGLNFSPEQLRRLSSVPTRVIALDSEPSAQKRAEKLVRDLSVFPGDTYLLEWSGKDAASSPREEIQEARRRFLV